MTTHDARPNAAEPAADDPHDSKIAPDDPRLKLSRHAFSGLKKKPVYAAIATTLAAGAIAIPLALRDPAPTRNSKNPASSSAEGAHAAEPGIVPDVIRDGPETAAALPTRKAILIPNAPADHALERLEVQQDVPPPPVYSHGTSARLGADTAPTPQIDEEEARADHASLFADAGEATTVNGSRSTAPGDDPYASAAGALAAATRAQQTAQAQALAAARNAEDPNYQGHKTEFLQSPGGAAYLAQELVKPRSPYELKAGTLIPSVLVSGINSDLPGVIIAQVRENVYDTISGRHLVVPQGSRLVAQYDSMVAWGQERVLLCWSRLILPNGNSISLECMPGADQGGYAGLTDKVNEHWWRIVKGAAITSLLSAGAVAAVSNSTSNQFANNFTGGAAQQVAQTGAQITERNVRVQPTLTVRPGWPLNVMVTKDMVLAPYVD